MNLQSCFGLSVVLWIAMPVIAQDVTKHPKIRVSSPSVDAQLIAGIENPASVPLGTMLEPGDSAVQIRLGDAKVTFSRNALVATFSEWTSMKGPLQALDATHNDEGVWCTVHEKCDNLEQIRHSVVFNSYTLEPDESDIFVSLLLRTIKADRGAVTGVEPTTKSKSQSDKPAKLIIADYHFPKQKDGVIGRLLLLDDKILVTRWDGYKR
jgi:hypothetical protein